MATVISVFFTVALILNNWRVEAMEEEIKKLKPYSDGPRGTDSQSYRNQMPSIKK